MNKILYRTGGIRVDIYPAENKILVDNSAHTSGIPSEKFVFQNLTEIEEYFGSFGITVELLSKISYVDAQKMLDELLYSSRTEEIQEKISEAINHLKRSYDFSLESSTWIECEPPEITSYWDRGVTSCYPKEDGSKMIWRWKQPKEENFVYCFTETVTFIGGIRKVENHCAQKPLVLDTEALTFFKKLRYE